MIEPGDLAGVYRERPRPALDHVSAEFWDGLRQGELRYQGCDSCGHVQFYPRALCTGCGGAPEWRVSSGHGEIYTFTVIRQNGARPFADQVPYVVAMIDVEPGVRMMGNVVGVDPAEVRIGMPVDVEIVHVDDDFSVPVWRASRA